MVGGRWAQGGRGEWTEGAEGGEEGKSGVCFDISVELIEAFLGFNTSPHLDCSA